MEGDFLLLLCDQQKWEQVPLAAKDMMQELGLRPVPESGRRLVQHGVVVEHCIKLTVSLLQDCGGQVKISCHAELGAGRVNQARGTYDIPDCPSTSYCTFVQSPSVTEHRRSPS